VQTIKRIFKLIEYNDETFKIAILKVKGCASLWYESLKNNQAREAKFNIKT